MKYDIQLKLPESWHKNIDCQKDEMGAEIVHLEAYLPDEQSNTDISSLDIYVGPTPEGETAEDQAFSNYADVVGFDDDDPEGFNPIEKIKFNGRNAFTFEALCEDDSPMKFISTEVRKGLLAVICMAAKDDKELDKLHELVERELRIRQKDAQ